MIGRLGAGSSLRTVFGHVVTLVTGATMAHAITLCSMPLLTRLYDKTEFGLYTLFITVSSITSIVSTGQYEFVVLSAEKDDEAWVSLHVVGLCSVLSAGAVFLIGLAARGFIPLAWIQTNLSIPFIACVSLSILLIGLYLGLYYWANRKKQYRRLASNRVLGAFAMALVGIGLGLGSAGAYGLIAAMLTGRACNALLLLAQTRREERARHRPLWSEIKARAWHHRDYPKYLLPSGFLQQIGSQIHIIFFSMFFGQASVGALGLYQQSVSLPVALVGSAIGDVFKQRASDALNARGECQRVFWPTFGALAALAIVPFICLYFFGPPLFAFVFGPEWRVSGQYAQIMAWMFLVGFVVSPLSALIVLAGKNKYNLYLQIFLVLATTTAIMVGYQLTGNVFVVLGCFTFAYCVKYAIEFGLSLRIAQGKL